MLKQKINSLKSEQIDALSGEFKSWRIPVPKLSKATPNSQLSLSNFIPFVPLSLWYKRRWSIIKHRGIHFTCLWPEKHGKPSSKIGLRDFKNKSERFNFIGSDRIRGQEMILSYLDSLNKWHLRFAVYSSEVPWLTSLKTNHRWCTILAHGNYWSFWNNLRLSFDTKHLNWIKQQRSRPSCAGFPRWTNATNKTMELYPKHLLKIQVLRNKQYSPLMKQSLKQFVCVMLIESSVEIQEMVIFKALVDRFS